MICPNCGMETNGKFCPSCGTKLTPPEPAVPDEAVKQAETAAAAAAAAIAAETVRPAPEQPAQGYAPGQAAPNPGYPNQGFVPSQTAPAQGYNPYPNQAPNPGYTAPNPGYPNQGFAPNPAAPNPGYAPYPNQPADRGYVPAQGYNPAPQSSGVGYRSPSPAEIGKSPASQLVRRLGSSGAFLIGVILTTIAFLVSLIFNGRSLGTYFKQISLYSGTEYADQLVGVVSAVISSLLFSAVCVLLLWLIFGAAANKRSPRMGTGALTTFKVFFIIGLVMICFALAAVIILGLIVLVSGDSGDLDDFLSEFITYVNSLLNQYGLQVASVNLSGKAFFGIAFGVSALCLIFGIIFISKLLKTINTAKRVVRTGRPDDRVSTFAAVLIILGALSSLSSAVVTMVSTGSTGLISGLTALLSAVASICFAVVIFKFRSGMRRLGVYKGVMTQPQ